MIGEIRNLLLGPSSTLPRLLEHPIPPQHLFLGWVVPLAAVRSVMVLARSFFEDALAAGIVLAIAHLGLQIGGWLALAVIFPTLAKQFGQEVHEGSGLALSTFALVPLWLGGFLFAFPDHPPWLYAWSRIATAACGAYGLLILYKGLLALHIPRRVTLPLSAALTAAFLTAYGVLFVFVGITTNIVFWITS